MLKEPEREYNHLVSETKALGMHGNNGNSSSV